MQEGILEISFVKLCDVLGLAAVKKEEILDKEIEDLIAERQEARKAKNLQEQMRFVMNSLQRESFLKIHVKE